VAAGLGFLEIGSDLAGSIRIPSHFCGIYGHKPSLDLVPLRGHIPPPPGVTPGPTDLPVAGPMARSADDLLLELGVLAGPDAPESVAYEWRQPAPRRARLREYRLGYVVDDPFCPVDAPMKEVLSTAIEGLRSAGVHLSEGWPAGVDPHSLHEHYAWLLAAFLSPTVSEDAFKRMQRAVESGAGDPWVTGTTGSHRDWLRRSADRLTARAIWQDYFKTHDAFLMPVSFVPAFLHDHRPMDRRRIATNGGERAYGDMSKWISFASLTGCPATVAPIGRTRDGLPVGLQIMGPFLEDATPIQIAALMADVTGGFVPPPEFA
jgi:amidase